ncbi:MAG: peptidoglycan D,D-transpeptidase FtsI family protein [Candidatus Brocadiales bacterium]
MLSKSLKIKLIAIGIVLVMAYVALGVQLVRVQLLDHEKYSKMAEAQHNKKVKLTAHRGPILDRKGRKLAESLNAYSIFANPSIMQEKHNSAHLLAKTLHIDAPRVLKLLEKKKRFVWIKRKITDSEAAAIKKLNLKGIGFREEPDRFYPNGKLCSHVIGFVDIDGKGLDGIELAFNNTLSGKSGYMWVRRDARQHYLWTIEGKTQPPRHGDGIILTIDAVIQNIVEDELRKTYKTHRPISATAVVMVPSTGEILAMANLPSYDPNFFWKYSSNERRNRAVTDCCEPGSLLKPITVSGVLENGLAAPDDVIFCHNGVYRIRKRTLHDVHEYGRLTLAEILIKSSNIGMAKLGLLMGQKRLHHNLHKFGFGEKTNVKLPGESSGIVRPLKAWSYYSTTSIPMGHEIAVTPLQFITAFCAIANGGELLRPRIVRAVTESGGKRIKKKFTIPFKIRRVMSSTVANDAMTPILSMVVSKGTGKKAYIPEYEVAGKTGTAQKLLSGGRGYSKSKYLSSFVGYAPAEYPEICVLVMLDEPRNGSYYGGTVAAPAVREIIRKTLDYMRIEPREGLPPTS